MTYMQIYKMRKKAADKQAEPLKPRPQPMINPIQANDRDWNKIMRQAAGRLPTQGSGIKLQEHKTQPSFRDRVIRRLKQLPRGAGRVHGKVMRAFDSTLNNLSDRMEGIYRDYTNGFNESYLNKSQYPTR